MSTVMSISEGLDQYIFRRKTEKTRLMWEEVDGRAFISRQSWHFLFIQLKYNTIKVLFPIYILTWRENEYISRQGKGIKRRNESTKGEHLYYHFQ